MSSLRATSRFAFAQGLSSLDVEHEGCSASTSRTVSRQGSPQGADSPSTSYPCRDYCPSSRQGGYQLWTGSSLFGAVMALPSPAQPWSLHSTRHEAEAESSVCVFSHAPLRQAHGLAWPQGPVPVTVGAAWGRRH